MSENFTETFRSLAETRFQSEMGIQHSAIPIQWDDVTFKQPDTGMWIAMTIMQNKAQRKSMGGSKFVLRTTGFIQFDVTYHVEADLRVDAQNLAEFACDIFFQQPIRGSNFKADFPEKNVMKAPAGAFGRYMARVFFTYDGFSTTRPILQMP